MIGDTKNGLKRKKELGERGREGEREREKGKEREREGERGRGRMGERW